MKFISDWCEVHIGISWRLVWSPQSKSARSAEHFSNLYSCERIPMLCLVTWRCSTKNTCHSSKDTAFGLWAAERFPEVDRTFGLWKEHRRRFPCSDLKRGLAKTNTKFTVV